METAIDKIRAVRNQRANELAQYEQQSQRLLVTIQNLKSQISGLDLAIAAASPEQSEIPMQESVAGGRYADMPMIEAVYDVIQRYGDEPGLLVPQIISKLQAGGFEPTEAPARLYPSIYAVAMRLLGRDKIREGQSQQKRTFLKK